MEESNTPLFPSIPKSMLEKYIGCPVLTYATETASKPGDNFMGVVFSVTADVLAHSGEKERRYYIIKCHPTHPSRQINLKRSNVFHKEHHFYTVLVKELLSFQKNILDVNYSKEKFLLAVPECQGGETIDYVRHPEKIHEPCSPLENFVMMTDLKKTFGYQMRDKKMGLDWDHLKLVVKELATFHALSWAYRKHQGIDCLNKRFPFLKTPFPAEDAEMWGKVLQSNLDIAIKALDSSLGEGNKLSESAQAYRAHMGKLLNLHMDRHGTGEVELWKMQRDPPKEFVEATAAEEPWRVICHGDCWTNNMVFKYNSSGLPQSVILLDYQITMVSCPTADLVYLMYSSTDTDLRKEHLETALEIYHDRFLEVCKTLKAEPFPGFSLDKLKMRYRCGLALAFLFAVFLLPILTKDEKIENLDDADDTVKLDDIFIEALKTKGNALYTGRILKTAEELYSMGVI